MTIRVAVVDDHTLVRAGIVALLLEIPGVEVVAEGADGAAARRLVSEHHPDILFLDLAMPGVSGLDALTDIHGAQSGVKVIVLSMHDSEEYVLRALRDGASGYLLKDVAPQELAQAIHAVMRGETWLSRPVSEKVIHGYIARAAEKPGELLTERQVEVLTLIAEGLGTREIAERLGVSIKTIETYRAQLMSRLDIHDVAGLVKYAIRHSLTTL
jgi:DNA-binding NarL/FixJ family response regulator